MGIQTNVPVVPIDEAAFSAGGVVFGDAGGVATSNSGSFFWDNVNLASTTNGVRLSATGSTATNVFLGQLAGNFTNTGSQSVGVGFNALQALTTGLDNVAVGWTAMQASTTAYNCVAVGGGALQANTTGFENVAIGWVALAANISGANNVALGNGALHANTTGTTNVAVGIECLFKSIDTTTNCGLGFQALHETLHGDGNAAFGYQALFTTTASFNSAFGAGALYNDTTGNKNAAFGYQAGNGIQDGGSNSAFGYLALFSDVSGTNNSAFGQQALKVTTGSQSCAFGSNTLVADTTGANNSAFGSSALYQVIGGSTNSAFGYLAGGTLTSGSSCLFIGANADASANNLTNAAAIGVGAIVTSSNTMLIGGVTSQAFIFQGGTFGLNNAANANSTIFQITNVTNDGKAIVFDRAGVAGITIAALQNNPTLAFYESNVLKSDIQSFNGAMYISTDTAKDIIFRINNAEAYRVNASGYFAGAAGMRFGMFAATPVVQQTAAGALGYADSGAVVVHSAGTFTGGVGATAYTIGDVVAALKNYGMLVS